METHFCEVIGCNHRASWGYIGDAVNLGEDYLCYQCWIRLCADRPQRAADYFLLSPLSDASEKSSLPPFAVVSAAPILAGSSGR